MPIWSGSRSIWTRRSGTFIRRQSVRTSVNRQPTASMTSACGRAARARTDRACPSEIGLRSSIRPLALSVVMTGAPSRRASASIAPAAPDQSAAAGQDDRAPGLGEDRGGLGDRVDRHGRGRGRRERRDARRRRAGRAHQVLRQEQGRRPGPSPGHRLERPAHQRRDLVDPPERAAPLRHRAEDPLEVDLVIVAALAVQRIGVDLAGEQEDRHRVGPALGDAGQRVGRAGAGGGADHPGLAGDPGRAVGGEGGGLLVADQERPDRAGPRQGVVDRRRVRARHAEQAAHSPAGQALHQDVRTGLHRKATSSSPRLIPSRVL